MRKIYYHVVTDKPIALGQFIIFAEKHYSGVYNRVYELKGKEDDIYSNPDKYNENNFGHHLTVALRELALEEIRLKKYPNYRSRLASLYVSSTLEEVDIELGRPTYSIVKIEVNGNEFIDDAQNCFNGTKDKNRNNSRWENSNNRNYKGKFRIKMTLASP